MRNITDKIYYAGAQADGGFLFENQYEVPNGVTYNSYVIMDEKTAVLDTADAKVGEQWLLNLKEILSGKKPDYLVVSHMEPDHAANIGTFLKEFPQAVVVANQKTFDILACYFDIDFSGRSLIVKEGDTLGLGGHTLQFFMAPMVHWPEVMVSYEQKEKILFSADAFGNFGKTSDIFLAAGKEEEWSKDAARYFLNIVGKYGKPVQQLLKKAQGLDIRMICPLHGPVLRENLSFFLDKYDAWSNYRADKAGVLVLSASIYGNTDTAGAYLAQCIQEKGVPAKHMALAGTDLSYAVAEAFRYQTIVFACATYDGGLFPCMEDLLYRLYSKNFQNRNVALVENGSWGPMAAGKMKAELEKLSGIEFVGQTVTVKGAVQEADRVKLAELAKAVAAV